MVSEWIFSAKKMNKFDYDVWNNLTLRDDCQPIKSVMRPKTAKRRILLSSDDTTITAADTAQPQTTEKDATDSEEQEKDDEIIAEMALKKELKRLGNQVSVSLEKVRSNVSTFVIPNEFGDNQLDLFHLLLLVVTGFQPHYFDTSAGFAEYNNKVVNDIPAACENAFLIWNKILPVHFREYVLSCLRTRNGLISNITMEKMRKMLTMYYRFGHSNYTQLLSRIRTYQMYLCVALCDAQIAIRRVTKPFPPLNKSFRDTQVSLYKGWNPPNPRYSMPPPPPTTLLVEAKNCGLDLDNRDQLGVVDEEKQELDFYPQDQQ